MSREVWDRICLIFKGFEGVSINNVLCKTLDCKIFGFSSSNFLFSQNMKNL